LHNFNYEIQKTRKVGAEPIPLMGAIFLRISSNAEQTGQL